MIRMLLAGIVVSLSGWLLAGETAKDKPKVVRTFVQMPRFFGAEMAEADAVEKALKQLPSFKFYSYALSGNQPVGFVEFDPAKIDVGDMAKAAASIKAKGMNKDSYAFVLLFQGKNAKVETIHKALEKVKGVEAKHTHVQNDGEVVEVVLSEAGGARLAEIHDAFKKANLKITDLFADKK